MPGYRNKEIERYYFEQFVGHYSLPPGKIEFSDKPDVIVYGERKIGIEITNFFVKNGSLPSSEQVQRKLRERVIAQSHQAYLSKGGKNFEISFGFDMKNVIGDRKEQKRLMREIIELAGKIEGMRTGQISKSYYQEIPELSFVYLNSDEYDEPRWRIFQSYSTPIMSAERLKYIVDTKEKGKLKYQKCDAYWLLCVIDFIDRAQDQQIDPSVGAQIDSEVFEKIFIYKTAFGEVLEI